MEYQYLKLSIYVCKCFINYLKHWEKNLTTTNQQLQRTSFGFNNEMPFWWLPAAV